MKVDLAKALRRRWYVVLIGLLLTPVLCLGATRVVGEKYEAKAMLVLLPPGASIPKAGNPYLNLGSMQPVVGVLSDSMLSQQTARDIRDVSPTASYTVTPDPSTSGAVLIIDVKDTTSAGAARVLNMLAKLAPKQLAELQSAASTPSHGRITTDLVAQDTKPVASHKTQQRAGLLVAAAGIALTVLAAAFVDGLAARRRRRRAVVRRGGHSAKETEDNTSSSTQRADAATRRRDPVDREPSEQRSESMAFDADDRDEQSLSDLDLPRLSRRF